MFGTATRENKTNRFYLTRHLSGAIIDALEVCLWRSTRTPLVSTHKNQRNKILQEEKEIAKRLNTYQENIEMRRIR